VKKQPINWGRVIGRLLEAGIGTAEGGFCTDENGRLVEDYAQLDDADSAEAYLAQLTRSGQLPAEETDAAEEDDLFAVFNLPSAQSLKKE
jgi:hypothetical protein